MKNNNIRIENLKMKYQMLINGLNERDLPAVEQRVFFMQGRRFTTDLINQGKFMWVYDAKNHPLSIKGWITFLRIRRIENKLIKDLGFEGRFANLIGKMPEEEQIKVMRMILDTAYNAAIGKGTRFKCFDSKRIFKMIETKLTNFKNQFDEKNPDFDNGYELVDIEELKKKCKILKNRQLGIKLAYGAIAATMGASLVGGVAAGKEVANMMDGAAGTVVGIAMPFIVVGLAGLTCLAASSVVDKKNRDITSSKLGKENWILFQAGLQEEQKRTHGGQQTRDKGDGK